MNYLLNIPDICFFMRPIGLIFIRCAVLLMAGIEWIKAQDDTQPSIKKLEYRLSAKIYYKMAVNNKIPSILVKMLLPIMNIAAFMQGTMIITDIIKEFI